MHQNDTLFYESVCVAVLKAEGCLRKAPKWYAFFMNQYVCLPWNLEKIELYCHKLSHICLKSKTHREKQQQECKHYSVLQFTNKKYG